MSLPEEHLKTIEAIANHAQDTHGIPLQADALKGFLEDRACVFHSVKILFDEKPLKEGEYGYMHQADQDPSKGFVLFLHPSFKNRPETHAHLVSYQLALVNFGKTVSPDIAERLGARLVGMDVEDYYQHLCQLTDSLREGTP